MAAPATAPNKSKGSSRWFRDEIKPPQRGNTEQHVVVWGYMAVISSTLWQLCDGDAWSSGECAGEASDTGEASGSTTRSVALLRQRSPAKGITGL